MAKRYRKKPVEVYAVQFHQLKDAQNFIREKNNFADCKIGGFDESDGNFKLKTLEGTMTVRYGDWIIKGINGEFYPCKPDIFEKTYDVVIEVDDMVDMGN